MRYYVIMNGVNSLTIQGLVIRELPPISKPSMRNIREEIDGRNGDIITELGYSAYDKELEIGLYGESYDINDIIAFFNGKGTITFSDEPDKYYYYQILNQIDYEKLLKFKTASVVFHCQPFKYKVDEVPLEEEFEYVEGEGTNITLNNTANAIFSEFDLKGNTEQDGTPTPTDLKEVETTTGRQEINIIGKNLLPLNIESGTTKNGLTITINDEGYYVLNGTTTANTTWDLYNGENITIPAGTYTASFTDKTNIVDGYIRLNNGAYQTIFTNSSDTNTFTITEPFTFNRFYIYITNQKTFNNQLIKPMLNVGQNALPYEKYKKQSYEINLGKNLFNGTLYNAQVGGNGGISASTTRVANVEVGITSKFYLQKGTYTISIANLDYCTLLTKDENNTIIDNFANSWQNLPFTFTLTQGGYVYFTGRKANNSTLTPSDYSPQLEKGTSASQYSPYFTPIELCKIGNYQDYLYKENNNWYIHKAIIKTILNGEESWALRDDASTEYGYYTFRNMSYTAGSLITASEGFSEHFEILTVGNVRKNNIRIINATGYGTTICIDEAIATTPNELKTWLSTHNTTVYSPLLTPTDEEITNDELINQLDALMLATSQDGQTNIIQSTFNLPFLIKLTALKQGTDHLIINNIGNIFAKPTLDLEGTGIVDIYLNDVEVFQVDLSEVNEIVLNTAEMEAYNPNTHQLANRQVTGDYSNFKLDVGENDLRFSGNLTKATVNYYQRWL